MLLRLFESMAGGGGGYCGMLLCFFVSGVSGVKTRRGGVRGRVGGS